MHVCASPVVEEHWYAYYANLSSISNISTYAPARYAKHLEGASETSFYEAFTNYTDRSISYGASHFDKPFNSTCISETVRAPPYSNLIYSVESVTVWVSHEFYGTLVFYNSTSNYTESIQGQYNSYSSINVISNKAVDLLVSPQYYSSHA